MENKQPQDVYQTSILEPWINYVCQAPFSSASFNLTAKALIASVFEAIQKGDSCIDVTSSQIDELHDLVVSAEPEHTIRPFVFDGHYLYLYRYWKLELVVAQHITRIKNNHIDRVQLSESQCALLSDPQQQKALKMVSEQALNIITGGPGTGKTYTLAHIIAILNETLPNIRIAMAAPTGKAAQRMKEALQKALYSDALVQFDLTSLKQLQPVTLHRLLGLGKTAQPRYHSTQPLPYDVIVVDEASMLDLNLSHMLFAAIPQHARLILLGDADQLASVDVGMVLADLQNVSALVNNHVNLVTTRRFIEGAKIGAMAQFIQQEHDIGQVIHDFENTIVANSLFHFVDLAQLDIDFVQLTYLPENLSIITELDKAYTSLMYGYTNYVNALKAGQYQSSFENYVQKVIHIFDQYRILTAIRYGAFGLSTLNFQIEQRFLKDLGQVKQGEWYEGRPVMMTYNDYHLGLSNGDIGICFLRETQTKTQFEVYFPSLEKWVIATRLPKNIETAFALTIHKSQGSEFSHVAVVFDDAAQKILSKELLYTAITRAKKAVSLLVGKTAFSKALTLRTTRKSGLLDKINEQLN